MSSDFTERAREMLAGYGLHIFALERDIAALLAREAAMREENERLRSIVPEALEKMNDDLCDDNERLRAALASAPGEAPAPAEAPAVPSADMTWLWTHCRAIGMNKKSDSGLWHHDIALFTIDLKTALASARESGRREGMAAPAEAPAVLQAGMDNGRLLAEWRRKLPGVEPTDRDLTAFALGAEVGFAHAQDLERQDWGRVHHAFKDAGIHPGRTDDNLADVLRAALASARESGRREMREEAAKVCERWGETHEPHITRNARNSARSLSAAIRALP